MIELLISALLAAGRRRRGIAPPPGLPEEELRAWGERRAAQSSLAGRAFLAAIAGHAAAALGFWLAFVRTGPPRPGREGSPIGDGLLLLGLALCMASCGWFAQGKGRSALWALVGIVPIFGPVSVGGIGRACVRCGAAAAIDGTRCGRCGGAV